MTLARAGYGPGGADTVVLAGPAAQLFAHWRRFLFRSLESSIDQTFETPVFIDRHVLATSRYLAHFPQQLFVGRGYRGRSRVRFLAPAACLHWYGTLEGVRLSRDRYSAFAVGPCARYEAGRSAYPYRLAVFHMAELVVFGSAELVEEQASAVEAMLTASFARLGIEGRFRLATDSFFMPSSRGARVLQQLKQLKREFASPVEEGGLALASINRHENTFGRAFRIRLANGETAHSFCAAFGLERLTAAGLLAWGDDPAHWPAELSG